MNDRREFTGDTLDDALGAAAAKLGVPVGEIDYDLIDEGRKGVFGLGVRQVRIRVHPPDPQARADEKPVEAPPQRSARRDRSASPDGEGPRDRPRRRSRRRGSRPRSRPEAPPEPRSAEPREVAEAAEVAPEHREVEKKVQHMFDLMQLDVQVAAQPSESGARLELAGRDRKLLLQKDAQLMSSVQFLLNRMARRTWPELGRVHLQCDGFRNRRDEDLVELVREVAQQVASTGRPKQLHPMNPYERRLAHLTVREFAGLESRSEGGGFLKRVIVSKP